MIKNKLFIALTFVFIPSSLILSATTSNAIAETQNSSKLRQCLINIRDSRILQPIIKSPEHQITEARVEVAIDTDSHGNVTNVRLVRSSGDPKLDEEYIRQARNWKLKPSGSNDVRVNTTPIKKQNAC
ncbi:hypothetical protein RIVM261_038560 [Rivularia sp. IAM M-261]|nr:hypothetical protein CAL7716_077600 [Calothrix sp. PCC 7716]GJD18900.1 hypothetical protein RIVM261_038560 [Rivularia sp. IAM M-261]